MLACLDGLCRYIFLANISGEQLQQHFNFDITLITLLI